MNSPQPNPFPSKVPTPATSTAVPVSEGKQKPPAKVPSPDTPAARTFSSPFLGQPTQSRSLLPWGLAPWHVFSLCLVLGLVTIGWRAKRRSDDAHARARTEALALAAAVESQFNQALSAAEILGALARQAGGAIPGFQKIAAELMASRPSVASLELQPGGVISDIVPRSGNERAIGFNVLKHPNYGPSAQMVIQKRSLSVQGPTPLYHGESGIIAREPLFVRGRDERDAFWGFVAVSMKFSDALTRARLDDLHRQGYSYLLYAPAAAGKKSVTLAAHGGLSVPDAVRQAVHAKDAEFQLALLPHGGWVNKTRLVLECLAAVAGSALLGLLLALLESRRALEADLAEKTERLATETRDRKQALDECRAAKDEASAARAELTKARETLQLSTEQEVRLNASVRTAEAAAQARQGELDQARVAQQQGEQMIRSLQARLADAAQAEKDAAALYQAQLQAAQASVADLQARLEARTRQSGEAGAIISHQPEPPKAAPPEPVAATVETTLAATVQTPDTAATPQPEAGPDADAPAPISTAEASGIPNSEEPPAPAAPKPPRTPKRKKLRTDNQMDLFAVPPAQAKVAAEPVLSSSPKQETNQAQAGRAEAPPASEPSAPAQPVEEEPSLPPASEPDSEPKEVRRPRRLPAPPPLNPAVLRKAANLILPLFTGQDPGAWDCLKANRDAFRSAFDPEDYVAFEQLVKKREFELALEHLKKAARRHGITV